MESHAALLESWAGPPHEDDEDVSLGGNEGRQEVASPSSSPPHEDDGVAHAPGHGTNLPLARRARNLLSFASLALSRSPDEDNEQVTIPSRTPHGDDELAHAAGRDHEGKTLFGGR